ncbi:MAG: hypothetical protein OXR82_08120 [Gammaproteobacteria bacterium]|nr:hypothetical protein [Gammaproteobacteria bacterium]MDE0258343.1 hypothetical protein [Gammaproteobacteria bacterium]
MNRRITIAMAGGEPMLVFWRVRDLGEALKAAHDMGLPLTSPRSVADTILGPLVPHLADAPGEA